MGISKGSFIKQLQAYAKKHNKKDVVRQVSLDSFAGCTIPVDVSIYCYIYMYTARKISYRNTDLLVDVEHSVLRSLWLEQYYDLIMAFLECNITPVICFDGEPFRLKSGTNAERKDKFNNEEDSIAEMRQQLVATPKDRQLQEKLRKALSSHVVFEEDDFDVLKQMFQAMGLPIIHEQYEAEAVAARLCWRGLCQGVVTNDTDVLPHDAPIMIRNIKKRYVRGEPDHRCECIFRNDVTQLLELTDTQFIEFCMLLGTDYNKNFRNYGFAKVLDMIKEHGTLAKCVDFLAHKMDVSDYRLADEDLRNEIFGYFVDELDFRVDRPLVVNYEEGLLAVFDKIFDEPVKKRMIANCGTTVKRLKTFNQTFAAAQKFYLDRKEQPDVVSSVEQRPADSGSA